MTFLVDTNVLSELMRANPDPQVLEWFKTHESDLLVDPIILGELQLGIMFLPAGRKRHELERWFMNLVSTIACVDWDRLVCLRWAKLAANARRKGFSLPVRDSMIAATALTHGLTVATRDVQVFRRAGLEVFDPFEE